LLDFWQSYDKAIVVRSFSKEYAMTGWRVGYVLGHENIIRAAAKVHDALTGCVPKISQRAAIAAITGSQQTVKTYQKEFLKRRNLAYTRLSQSQRLSCLKPQGAYYAFARYNQNISSVELAEQLLTKAGVAVIPGKAFGKGGEGHVRLSFAVEEGVLAQGIKRIAAYLAKIS
jgi:aspartate/methionine/tyrosine aminotransferase